MSPIQAGSNKKTDGQTDGWTDDKDVIPMCHPNYPGVTNTFSMS